LGYLPSPGFSKSKNYSESKPNDESLKYLKRALTKYFAYKPNDDSQERMERQPRGLLQAQLQSMGLVELLEGGLRVATTMAKVTLVIAAAITVTGLPLGKMLSNMIGLERYLSLSGLLDPTRR